MASDGGFAGLCLAAPLAGSFGARDSGERSSGAKASRPGKAWCSGLSPFVGGFFVLHGVNGVEVLVLKCRILIFQWRNMRFETSQYYLLVKSPLISLTVCHLFRWAARNNSQVAALVPP